MCDIYQTFTVVCWYLLYLTLLANVLKTIRLVCRNIKKYNSRNSGKQPTGNKCCHRAEVSDCLDLKQNVEAARLAKVTTSITQACFAV